MKLKKSITIDSDMLGHISNLAGKEKRSLSGFINNALHYYITVNPVMARNSPKMKTPDADESNAIGCIKSQAPA